jgi:hypothetical protein
MWMASNGATLRDSATTLSRAAHHHAAQVLGPPATLVLGVRHEGQRKEDDGQGGQQATAGMRWGRHGSVSSIDRVMTRL